LEDIDVNRRIGNAAREWVTEAVGTWSDCAARYTGIYNRLIGR